MDDDPLYEKARHVALRYLAYRMRSREEVQSKLAGRGFDGDVIKKVVDRFCDLGYLDDRNFAGQRAKSLAADRLWGNRKIAATLREKGIPPDLIEAAIAGARGEKSEQHAIRELVEKRLRSQPVCEVFSYKGKRRLVQSLTGRGFPVNTILDVLREMGDAYDSEISAEYGAGKGDTE